MNLCRVEETHTKCSTKPDKSCCPPHPPLCRTSCTPKTSGGGPTWCQMASASPSPFFLEMKKAQMSFDFQTLFFLSSNVSLLVHSRAIVNEDHSTFTYQFFSIKIKVPHPFALHRFTRTNCAMATTTTTTNPVDDGSIVTMAPLID